MKNNFLYPVSVSGTTILCDRDLIELVRKKGGDQLAEALVNRLSRLIAQSPAVDTVPMTHDLDSTDLIRRKDVLWITKETGAMETQSRVRELPAINAVLVTRCKDCIHSEPVASLPKDTLFCNTNDLPFPADGFCSRGLRKEDNKG